jgi:hypothetical protein
VENALGMCPFGRPKNIQEYNIKIDIRGKVVRMGSSSGLCPMGNFGISSVVPLASTIR